MSHPPTPMAHHRLAVLGLLVLLLLISITASAALPVASTGDRQQQQHHIRARSAAAAAAAAPAMNEQEQTELMNHVGGGEVRPGILATLEDELSGVKSGKYRDMLAAYMKMVMKYGGNNFVY